MLAAVVVLAAVLAMNFAALDGDASSLEAAVRTGFAQGELPTHHTIAPDRRIGAFTYHDCLILTMALERRLPIEQIAVSPARLRPIGGWEESAGACATLLDAFVAGNQQQYEPAPYHRYISAPVGLAALLVPRLGLDDYRLVLKVTNYVLCASLLLICLARLLLVGSGNRRIRRKMLTGSIVFTVFLLFSGMEFFAQNLSIGLADLCLLGLYGVLILANPGAMRRGQIVGLSAAFFAVIAAFEYWTGQLLMALAGGIGLIGLDIDTPRDRHAVWARTMDFVATALATVVAIVGLKLGLASFIFDENLYAGFLRQLGARAGGAEYGVGSLLLHLGGRLAYVGQGSLVLGIAQASAAIAAGMVGLYWVLHATSRNAVQLAVVRYLIASVVVLILWHLIFRNQSTIHAHFMIRTFAWASAAGWVMLAVGFEVRRAAATPGWISR